MSAAPSRAVRRYPHLTREDVEMLRLMPEEMAREFEALIDRQWRSDRRHEQHRAGEVVDMDTNAVHRRVHGQGAGGGHRRGLPPGRSRE